MSAVIQYTVNCKRSAMKNNYNMYQSEISFNPIPYHNAIT